MWCVCCLLLISIKSFIPQKNNNIFLIENDAITNGQTGIATVLNDYNVNVTKSICQPDLLDVNEDIEDVLLMNSMNRYNILDSV